MFGFCLVSNTHAVRAEVKTFTSTSMLDGRKSFHEIAIKSSEELIAIENLPADVREEVVASDYHETGEYRRIPDGGPLGRIILYRGVWDRKFHGGYEPQAPLDGITESDIHGLININSAVD